MPAWHFPEHTAHLERLAFETDCYNRIKANKKPELLKHITYTKEDIKELRSLYTNVHHGLNIYYESVRIHCYSSSLVPWWDEYSCG